MENKTLFIIVIFVAALCSNSFLVAQNDNQSAGTSLQAVGQNNSDDSYSLNNQATPLLDQNSSPLMMFRAGEKAEQKTSDRERDDERSRAARGAASADSSSAEARGTFSGIAEEDRDDGSLTLDRFRTALTQHPTAARFVILEDEESGISLQPRVASTSRVALKSNRAENETIADMLRELLVIRHGGNPEVVNSFFNGVIDSADAPLSAEGLGEILRRSDAAQNSETASQKIASQTSQIASPFHTLESELRWTPFLNH